MLARWFRRQHRPVDQHEEVDQVEANTAPPPTESTTTTPAAAAAAAPLLLPMTAVEHVERILHVLSQLAKMMMVFTFVQIMCALQVEQVHFLTLYSIFVPWVGFEGVKVRNFAYLRLYYWGCAIMIPTNLVHYYSFQEYVDNVLANDTTLSAALKRELEFNEIMFSISTALLVFLMTISVVLVNRLSKFRALLLPAQQQQQQQQTNRTAGGLRSNNNSGLLTVEEIAALPKCKIESKEDVGEICVVCQDEFVLGDTEAKRLHCNHLFHAKCIDAWLERSCLCPICNGDVRSIV